MSGLHFYCIILKILLTVGLVNRWIIHSVPGNSGVHDQVVVMRRQAAGMADAIAVLRGLSPNLKNAVPVLIIAEDRLLGVVPGGQVVKGAVKFDLQGPYRAKNPGSENTNKQS